MPWAEEKKMSQTVSIASLLLLATMSGVALAQSSSGLTVVNIKPVIDRKSALNPPSAPSNLTAHDNGIQYHGGPVMSTPQGVNVYFIWYGNWAGKKEPQVRPDKVAQIYLQDPDGYWIEVNDDHS